MNKVIKHLKSLVSYKTLSKEITVYGWKYNFNTTIIRSPIKYLFTNLNIIEHIASITNENRDGRIREKHYIAIHDTGETTPYMNAKFWSDVVYNMEVENNKYSASFQYVVDENEIYHNIPDNEIAYHAGDSTKVDYNLIDTKIPYTKDINITISNGNYFINGIDTKIKAPCNKELFNDEGILIKEVNGTFHIGETYFNETYQKIANRGGNNSGIGMEVCVNENSDIYKTWLRSAKLTAYLMDKYNLSFDAIKQHHYFSGKDCPMTLRKNNLYPEFLEMVEIAYTMLQFEKEGYEIKLIPKEGIDSDGRITTLENDISFIIETTYKGEKEICEFKN